MNKGIKNNSFWDLWGPTFFTLALYFGVRIFIAEARYIPSGSMLPGLKIKDRLVIEKITYKIRSPKRGEIVVFNSPYSFDKKLKLKSRIFPLQCLVSGLPLLHSIPGLNNPVCDAYIKRVIAIGGDNVSINYLGKVKINSIELNEPYVENFCEISLAGMFSCPSLYKQVPDGHVLVLGDNRANSWDSRFWPGSPFLPEKEIIGRAVWRFWPFNRLGLLGLQDHKQ